MAIYADVFIEAEFSGAGNGWTDISADVLTPIRCAYGIRNNGPLDRIASKGFIKFDLNNSITNSGGKDGYYSPGHADARSGFDSGIGVRIKFTFENYTKYKFKGKIVPGGINPVPGEKGPRITGVSVNGWMEQATKHKMDLPALAENKDAGEMAELVVNNMIAAMQPANAEYNNGVTNFALGFDTLKKTTTAYAELYKIVLAELGFAYVKGDKTDGQTLVIDGRNTRGLQTQVKQLIVGNESAGFLLKEDGGYLLQENGDKIILDEVQGATLVDLIRMSSPARGKDIYNVITTKSYPRRIDAAATTILWTLNNYIEIAAGDTKEPFKAYYRDPANLATSVGGKDIRNPIATTDYLMNASSDGTGADLTASLTVTLSKGANGVDVTLVNVAAQTGYVTFLQIVGKGIYTYEPVEFSAIDQASIDKNGTIELRLDLKYVDQPLYGESVGALVLEQRKDAASFPNAIWYNANRSDLYMYAFLQIEPGDRFYSEESQTGIGDDYIVNGVEFEILENGIINYAFTPSIYTSEGDKWYLGVAGLSELGVTTKLGA